MYGLELTTRVASVLITTTTPAYSLGTYISAEIGRVLFGRGAVDRVEVATTHSSP